MNTIESSYDSGPLTVRFGEKFTGESRHSDTIVYTNHPIEPNIWYTDLDMTYDLGGGKETKVAFLHIEILFAAPTTIF